MENSKSNWIIVKESVRGYSHIKAGLENQDSIFTIAEENELNLDNLYIISVCDGHGSTKSLRSKIGSQLAASISSQIIKEFIINSSGLSLSTKKNLLEENIIKKIHYKWIEEVKKNFNENPLSNREKMILTEKYGEKILQQVKNYPVKLYGTTLLSVVITDEFMFFLQNGDGDILVVKDNEEVIKPLMDDSRLFANETTSLSNKNAWEDFRTAFQVLVDKDKIPKLIMLATDGYSNSFVTNEGFLLVSKDILNELKEKGVEYLQNNLKKWLNEASEAGSGDDITVGILYRIK